jgi:hypothetical protein
MRRSSFTPLGLAALLVTAAGCAFSPPERATIVAQPQTLPVRNVTSFSASLRCMDDLFVRFGKTSYLVTAQEISGRDGKVQTGTKEMLISAISQMSIRSNAFNFIDLRSTARSSSSAASSRPPAGRPFRPASRFPTTISVAPSRSSTAA